jgi:hypothetical protein
VIGDICLLLFGNIQSFIECRVIGTVHPQRSEARGYTMISARIFFHHSFLPHLLTPFVKEAERSVWYYWDPDDSDSIFPFGAGCTGKQDEV